jgi:EmrB/QacA subfamily drug resistance transporter
MSDTDNTPSKPAGDGAALAALALSAFLTPFMGNAANIMLPDIGREFGMTVTGLSWVTTAFVLSAAVFLPPFGRLADIHGRRRFFLAGILVFTLSSVCCLLSRGGASLIAARALQGLGSAMIFGTSMAMASSLFPPPRLGRALGVIIGSVYTGISLGPVIGGFMTSRCGWRSVFVLTAALGICAWVFCARSVKGERDGAKGESFDLSGSVLYGVSACLVLSGTAFLPKASGWAFLAGGLAAGALFFTLERRTRHPVVDTALFLENRVFSMSCLAAVINYSATFAVSFLLSLHLQWVTGMEPGRAGFILLASPVVMALVSPLAGRLADRTDPGKIASAGMALTALGLIPLCALGKDSPPALIVVSLLVMGTGFGVFSSPNISAMMRSVEKSRLGMAASINGAVRLFGQMLSMGFATTVLSLTVGDMRAGPDTAPHFLTAERIIFVIFLLLCGLGIIPSLARGRPPVKGGGNGVLRPGTEPEV